MKNKKLLICKPIKLINQIAVIDGTAWFAYALMALSLYVFRQPSYVLDQGPFSHRWENLPKIFIPNNLTGPEIGRALRTSSKAQILAENNKVGPFFPFNISFITPELSHKNPCKAWVADVVNKVTPRCNKKISKVKIEKVWH